MAAKKPRHGRSHLVLVINPGSTSTKLALFRGRRLCAGKTVRHGARAPGTTPAPAAQGAGRAAAVLKFLVACRVTPAMLDAVSARGGLLAPCRSGTYLIGEAMLRDLAEAKYGSHAGNLGAPLAFGIARQGGCPAFIVDPVVVDEMIPAARLSGLPEIRRRSVWHALNQKAVARLVAHRFGRRYEEMNLIVAHLGGGTSVAAHRRGRAIEVNNALDGDGPFAVERSGGLPAGDLVRLARRVPEADLLDRITGAGGVVAYLGTNDMRAVERRAAAGDRKAREVMVAMAHQIAREIGACAAVLRGEVDAVVITGGLARSRPLVGRLRRQVGFIGPVRIVPGEMEMQALAQGALRVLTGRSRPLRYRG